ncbi:hypothetical protein [Sphingobacterium yanglingense]|uniref:Repeat protein (TIGR01451 family) n=1 Tax=Sphingobacterium yanglingense TaxID=1437280 RepID=A0A4R6WEZ3_9SPHI|nr:hypothetical protein [Sphingobacterium yanglingense]TDQ76046.1 hypothetical protein CLV99_3744 [Sphingobacterium yanglingense]
MKKHILIKKASLLVLFVFSLLVLNPFSTIAQIRKTFEPRQSTKAPLPYTNVKNYNLQGDFLMLGNTSLTLSSYIVNRDNSNNSMIYVDVDGDNSTVNSSTAALVLPGGECTEVIYAGLYWSGRAHNGGSSNDEFTVKKNNINYALNKRKVKLKQGNNAYVDVLANANDIYYPSNTDGNMYSAYADVTDYVRQNGAGNYTVANLALIEGNGGGTGFYGGWGMVIIYKNASMKWRDITVFDGHAYVAGGTYSYQLPISGFKATQHGNVNVTLGMMAGEGDRMISGDYFEIRRGNTFDRLSHSGNSTGNFFNSSIEVGGTWRNPNLVNNTGFDVARFDLDNTNNRYIANNATNATFRYGSTQDTYVIYNMVFAVDAYVPEVVGENTPLDLNGTKPINGGSITPGQNLEFNLDIFNKGDEAVNDTKIEIPVPYNLHYAGANIIKGAGSLGVEGAVTWVPPLGASNDPNITAGGKIIWTIGNLPKDVTKQQLLATLKYRFRVSDNCTLLTSANGPCGLEVKINGKISGTGATSGTAVSSDLVRDYGNGKCNGPVYDDFISTITISADYIEGCDPPVENGIRQFKAFCELAGNAFSRNEIVDQYPAGTKFFNKVPTSYDSNDGLVTGDFAVSTTSGQKTSYYAVVPGMDPGCYLKLETSLEKVTTSPIVNNVSFCLGGEVVLDVQLSDVGKANGYNLYYYDSNGQLLAEAPKPTEVGEYSYKVAEGTVKDGKTCIGPLAEFTVVINELPTIDTTVPNVSLCENNDGIVDISTTGATSYVWEYTTSTAPDSWRILSNSTFSNSITVTNSKLNISHAPKAINGIKVRLKVDNGKCPAISNEIVIEVKDCHAITNPMLPNKAVR